MAAGGEGDDLGPDARGCCRTWVQLELAGRESRLVNRGVVRDDDGCGLGFRRVPRGLEGDRKKKPGGVDLKVLVLVGTVRRGVRAGRQSPVRNVGCYNKEYVTFEVMFVGM